LGTRRGEGGKKAEAEREAAEAGARESLGGGDAAEVGGAIAQAVAGLHGRERRAFRVSTVMPFRNDFHFLIDCDPFDEFLFVF
jgi:hypothetical protein